MSANWFCVRPTARTPEGVDVSLKGGTVWKKIGSEIEEPAQNLPTRRNRGRARELRDPTNPGRDLSQARTQTRRENGPMRRPGLGNGAALGTRISVRVQLNRFLNSFCYVEVGSQGAEWQNALNRRMVQQTIPGHVLEGFPEEIAGSEDIRVVNDKSLGIWREANPRNSQIEEAKALLSKGGFKALRTRYPVLAKALYASIRASHKAWQKRVPHLACLRTALYNAWTDKERIPAIAQPSPYTSKTSCAVFYVALIEAYQDLGLPGGLRSEVNRKDPNLILVGTVERGDVAALLSAVEARILESLQAHTGP